MVSQRVHVGISSSRKLSRSHGAHWLRPGTLPSMPAGHGTHTLPFENSPTPHGAHAVAAALGSCPGAHVKHCVAAGSGA